MQRPTSMGVGVSSLDHAEELAHPDHPILLNKVEFEALKKSRFDCQVVTSFPVLAYPSRTIYIQGRADTCWVRNAPILSLIYNFSPCTSTLCTTAVQQVHRGGAIVAIVVEPLPRIHLNPMSFGALCQSNSMDSDLPLQSRQF